ncbi:Oleoyl-acyl carrier protein thioesterase 1 [Heracleum sosnowskyi]|uniref:Oleoyl-acyl carrier protein thioesterase 1 n=1 Tax=Heracleum sosnowskyi TaxID=360622 RepID=A0AAD8LXQ5_9APIA|nr:Oleoyl-acyl carrier protein thioesterase 1 [Heracleum sosnowskyi]
MDGDSSVQVLHPQYLKTCSKLSLDLGSVVYLLGYAEKRELTVGGGKVVIATDNLIKLSTDGVMWSPGSAGYDVHGNLAFMVCDPMKLATSPNTKSTSTSSSSSSWKRDPLMQFGIPIPIICDWLNQHWERNLDELTKPKLPVIRLMSAGPKSEQSCASFTKRQVFKSTEAEDDETPSFSNLKTKDIAGPCSSHVANAREEDKPITESQTVPHLQGIPTPEIYESPKLISAPFRKNESALIQLLDINFPPRIIRPAALHQPARKLLSELDENIVKAIPLQHAVRDEHSRDQRHDTVANAEIASTGSCNVSGQGRL